MINELDNEKEKDIENKKMNNKGFSFITLVSLLSISFFMFSICVNTFIDIKVSQNTYLTFHVFVEIASALIALSIFVVLFFTYDIFYRKYSLILANTFFITSIIDIFHMITYDGMFNLFGSSLQTPTYFWLFSRTIFGLGLLFAFITKKESTLIMKKSISLIFSVFLVALIFIGSLSHVKYMPELIIPDKGLSLFKIGWEYILTIVFIINIILYINRIKGNLNKPHINMLSGLLLSVFAELCFMLYVNVYDSLNIAGHLFKLASYIFIFWAVFVKNVRRPYQKIFEQKEMLTLSINDLHIAMEEKTVEIYKQNIILERINSKMKDDLEATKAIQQAMFPKSEVIISDLRFNAEILPYEQLSGDYINYFNIDNKNVGFYIMDVSGHGVAAAMLGVFAAQSIGESMRIKYKEASVFSPAAVLNHFYALFNKSNFPDELHIVMLYGMYNKDSNKVVLSSAGLNCKPIKVSQEGRCRFIEIEGGFPICKLGEVYEPDYIDYEIDMKFGEKLILYTDGLTEMRRTSGGFWGADSFLAYMQCIGTLQSFDIKENIKIQVSENIKKTQQEDDITFCVIEKLSI